MNDSSSAAAASGGSVPDAFASLQVPCHTLWLCAPPEGRPALGVNGKSCDICSYSFSATVRCEITWWCWSTLLYLSNSRNQSL